MKFYDTNGDGVISFEEFLRALKDDLNERCQAIVDKAFRILDRDGSGVVNINDIKNIYDVSSHPDFLEGRLTKD